MEDLPYDGYDGCSYNHYVRRHNPFPWFTGIPGSAWVGFTRAEWLWQSDRRPPVSSVSLQGVVLRHHLQGFVAIPRTRPLG